MPTTLRQFKRIPHWVAADHASILHLQDNPFSQRTRDWLLDSASLTLRIKQYCQSNQMGCFSVKLLWQGMGIPSNDEVQRLKLKSRRYALIREVILYCGETPLIFARTVIPIKTLTGPQRQLGHLGNRPLGAFLFAQPGLQRDAMEVASVSQGHQLFDSAMSWLSENGLSDRGGSSNIEFMLESAYSEQDFYLQEHLKDRLQQKVKQIWARRSIFCLRHKPLLVAEVFLPDVFRQPTHQAFIAPVLTGVKD